MKRACVSLVAVAAAATAVISTIPTQSATASTAVAAAPAPAPKKLVGFTSPADVWSQRIKTIGACGVEARRVFATLQSDGRAQSTVIQQTVAAGMMPVISYKVPNVATLLSGGYDSWLKATRTYLDGLDVPVTVTFWHEPYGDLDPADFRAGSQKFLDLMKTTDIKVGPILNGWLLDSKVSDFAGFTSKSLLTQWDFVAVDSYQTGTAASPGSKLPGRAVPLLARWLDGQGFPDKKIGVGEYNGFSGSAMKAAGDTILSTPEVWFGLAWESATGATDTEYGPLVGDRLTAYQATKADSRAARDTGC
jgi:hypothetical protein